MKILKIQHAKQMPYNYHLLLIFKMLFDGDANFGSVICASYRIIPLKIHSAHTHMETKLYTLHIFLLIFYRRNI